MDWSQLDMDRLFELYVHNFHQLRSNVISVNRTLGSITPEKTLMEQLSRSDFEKHLKNPHADPGVVRRWVCRIIRGHENKFPMMQVA